MNLYIQIENNAPLNHPATEENLISAFGSIPNNWTSFVRIAPPITGNFEKYLGCTYELIDGIYTDVHHIEKMTAKEINEKAKALGIPLSWQFNNNLFDFEPPVPYPQDDKQYYWDEPSVSWKEFTPVVRLP